MKVLVLGNSDTAGLFSGGKTWTAIVQEGLTERLDALVELKETPFSVLGRTAPGYAEKKVSEFEPELVILPVGTFPFTIGFVWKRVERLFGRRAGRWYKRLEDSFDAKTRARGTLRDHANRAARVALRRTIGAQPLATQEETTVGFRSVLRSLARIENSHVILVSYGQRGQHHFVPGGIERRRAFIADVAAAAREHHFVFLDGNEAFKDIPLEVATTTPDGFHQNQYGHELLGAFVVSKAVEALQVRA